MKRTILHWGAGVGATVCVIAAAAAQYPTQPVRLIVGYSAGGSVDLVARDFAQRMSAALGQPVVVENRGGASGAVAAQFVANAKPDGYTLYFVASPTLTIVPAIQPVSFAPSRDFTPIGLVVDYFNVLLVNSESSYRTVQELIEDARRRPGELTYGSAGVGAANHVSGELLADGAGVKLTHVPYKGNAPAMLSLMAGQIAFAFDVNNTAMNHVRGGKLRPVAVTSTDRQASFPGVPTLRESGYPDADFTGWFGIVGPAGMQKDVVEALVAVTTEITQSADFRERMAESGYSLPDPRYEPKELLDRTVREGAIFASLVERAGLSDKQ